MIEEQKIDFSIVTTMYNSYEFINEFYSLSTKAVRSITNSYEIIFVNDGSPDDSLEKACSIAENDSHIKVIDLSRNFGHHRAIMVGLEYARGKRVFLIDCDLEENPLFLSDFIEEMDRTQADVVYGVQNVRKGSGLQNFGGALFWKIFNLISEVKITPNIITSRIMNRRYIDALLNFREKELFIDGIFVLAGFLQIPIIVKKESRNDSSYTFNKRFALLINAITSFSNRPLILVFYFGLIISLVSGSVAASLFVGKLLYIDFMIGWASVVVSIWFIGGISIFCIGLVGMYISKIFIEVKERPLFIVRNVFENKMKN